MKRPTPVQWSAILHKAKEVGLIKALAYYGFTESVIYCDATKQIAKDNWKKRQVLIQFPEA